MSESYFDSIVAGLKQSIDAHENGLVNSIANLQIESAELAQQIESLDAQLVTAETEIRLLTADIDALGEVVKQQAALIKLQEDLIAELQALLNGAPAEWKPLYQSKLATNDGWSLRQETQSNDGSYNHPKNVQFTNRGMVVQGIRENLGGRSFTTGDALGQHIKVPNYFRAEVTATLPTDYGMWPCPLWFRPSNHADGEIDVCETWTYDWNGKPKFWSTIHSEYGPTHKQENAGLEYSKLPNPDPAVPHTYIVEKVPGRITFWCDDVLVYSWERANFNNSLKGWFDRIFEQPGRMWYPRVTLQIGGAHSADPKLEWQQSEMVIHELKIYEQA